MSSDDETLDLDGAVSKLNNALRLQHRSVLEYTLLSAAMTGFQYVGIAAKLAEFARSEVDDSRRIAEKIASVAPSTLVAEPRWSADPNEAFEFLIEDETEAIEALQASIEATGREAARRPSSIGSNTSSCASRSRSTSWSVRSAHNRLGVPDYRGAMEAAVEQLKQRARKTWAAGDFDDIARMFPDVGPRVAEEARVEPGMQVLDVACGTGAATIPAAAAGGVCTGLDLIPAMFDAARAHAAEAGVEIEWVEGDAEDLPFDDASFDRVISQFGVMFAPQHRVAAAELARVTAPGGVIVVASWTPEGMIGDMFKVMARHLPPAPAGAKPPVLWGNEDHVRSLLEPHGVELTFERPLAAFRGNDVEELISRFESNYGPWTMARAAVGDDWPQLRSELYDLFERSSRPAEPGGVEALGEYLLARGRKTS